MVTFLALLYQILSNQMLIPPQNLQALAQPDYIPILNVCPYLGDASFLFSSFPQYNSFLPNFMESWNNLKFK